MPYKKKFYKKKSYKKRIIKNSVIKKITDPFFGLHTVHPDCPYPPKAVLG